MLYHMDSIQFALALDRFDVTVHQPHPPGYFLYVMLGRLFNFFIQDPNTTFITISILFSALAVVVIYYLGKELFDSKCALIAALLAITSPNLWFHGELALSYTVEAFLSAFIAFLCWKIYNGRESHIWLLAFVMAVAGGIRQNAPVFLLPLCVFSVWKLPLRKILASVCLFAGSSLLWFVPMTQMTGGLDTYNAALRVLWASTAANKTVFDQGFPAFSHHAIVLFHFFVYGIGGGLVLLAFCLYYLVRNNKLNALDYNKVVFFSLWILPSFLFFLLIAIHPSVPGHVLIFLPPLLLLTAGATGYLCTEMKRLLNLNFLSVTTFILIVTNVYMFFFFVTPRTYLIYPASYTSIREHDKFLSLVVERLKTFDPETVVLFLDVNRIYFGLFHATYYLPEHTFYDPRVISHPLTEDKKIWGGLNKRIILTDRIVLPRTIKSYATLLFTDEPKKLPGKGMVKIEPLVPGIYLLSGPIGYLGEIYPGVKIIR